MPSFTDYEYPQARSLRGEAALAVERQQPGDGNDGLFDSLLSIFRSAYTPYVYPSIEPLDGDLRRPNPSDDS